MDELIFWFWIGVNIALNNLFVLSVLILIGALYIFKKFQTKKKITNPFPNAKIKFISKNLSFAYDEVAKLTHIEGRKLWIYNSSGEGGHYGNFSGTAPLRIKPYANGNLTLNLEYKQETHLEFHTSTPSTQTIYVPGQSITSIGLNGEVVFGSTSGSTQQIQTGPSVTSSYETNESDFILSFRQSDGGVPVKLRINRFPAEKVVEFVEAIKRINDFGKLENAAEGKVITERKGALLDEYLTSLYAEANIGADAFKYVRQTHGESNFSVEELILADRNGRGAIVHGVRNKWIGSWVGAEAEITDGKLHVKVDDPSFRNEHLKERRFELMRLGTQKQKEEWLDRIQILSQRVEKTSSINEY